MMSIHRCSHLASLCNLQFGCIRSSITFIQFPASVLQSYWRSGAPVAVAHQLCLGVLDCGMQEHDAQLDFSVLHLSQSLTSQNLTGQQASSVLHQQSASTGVPVALADKLATALSTSAASMAVSVALADELAIPLSLRHRDWFSRSRPRHRCRRRRRHPTSHVANGCSAKTVARQVRPGTRVR